MDLQSLSLFVSGLLGIGSLIVAVLVARNGTGQAARRFEEKIDLALERFGNTLDEKLERRFKGYVEERQLDLNIELLKQTWLKDAQRMDAVAEQMDHRIKRNSEQLSMLMDTVLKAGINLVGTRTT